MSCPLKMFSYMGQYAQDEMLLPQIERGDRQVLKDLYTRYREPFKLFLIRLYHCYEEDALEVYPEAFSKFFFNVRDHKLTTPLRSSLKTYLFSIGKHIFYKRFFGKYQKQTELSDSFDDIREEAAVLDFYDATGKAALVQKLLNQLDEPCRELLTLIFLKEYTSEAVAEEMQIPSTGAVRKRKCLCLGKLRALLEKSEELKAFL